MTSAEDTILKALAETARARAADERARLDERWDRFAAGELSDEQMAELEESAARSPEGAEAFAAFRPLGDDFAARTAAAIRAERGAQAEPIPEHHRASVLPFEKKSEKRLETKRPQRMWALGLAAAAALIAAVTVGPLLRRGPSGPLPDYTAELMGGNAEVRGEVLPMAEALVLTTGAPFELVVRPETPTTEKLALRCFLVPADGGAARPFPACDKAERSPQGSFRVRGVVGQEIDLETGTWELWTIVGRAGALPQTFSRTVAGGAKGEGWTSRRAAQNLRVMKPGM